MGFEQDMNEATEIFDHLQEEENAYLYFEFAYTRYTGWMGWLIDREGGARYVFARGQGNKERALEPVLAALRKMADGTLKCRSMAFKDAEPTLARLETTPATSNEALRLALSGLTSAIRAVGRWDGPRVGLAMENAERVMATTKGTS